MNKVKIAFMLIVAVLLVQCYRDTGYSPTSARYEKHAAEQKKADRPFTADEWIEL